MNFEVTLLSNLVTREEFGKKVFPFIKEEYFDDKAEKTIFCLIRDYVNKYSSFPHPKSLALELTKLDTLSEDEFNSCRDILSTFKPEELEIQWLVDQTEEFCKERSLHNAIKDSILIINNKHKTYTKGMIPQLVSDALAVSFTTDIGHDYFEDAAARWDFFHNPEQKIPFRLEYFNRITRGGISKKTLTVIIAGTGVGKSFLMGQFAADNLLDGKNVLYISLEMGNEEIGKRIDACLLDWKINDLDDLSKEKFLKMVDRIKSKTPGKLVFQEYPTSAASVLHFKHLLNDLKLKKNFIPDIVYVDYLGICASSRLKLSNQVNSYALMKAVAEELRALAKEANVPVVTAVQLNREGFKSSDPGMESTSESFGIPFTADLMLGLISTEELEGLNQLMVKQFKNRYNDKNRPLRFMIGVDRSKMKAFDLEESAQVNITSNKINKSDEEEMEYLAEGKRLENKSALFEDFK